MLKGAIITAFLAAQSFAAFGDTPRHVAAIVLQFPDAASPRPETMLWTRDVMATVDAFYAEQSYGNFTTTTEVFGVLVIDSPPAGLSADATRMVIAREAQEALLLASIDLSPFWVGNSCATLPCAGDFIYISPAANIGAGGIGLGTGVWMASGDAVSAPSFSITAHELGHHFFNWNHDHGIICTNGPFADPCTTYPYGDSLSVMGHGTGHVSPEAKMAAGWLIPQAVTQSGDYLLSPYEIAEGVTALQVTGGSKRNPLLYTIEYRQPIGFDQQLGVPWVDQANVYGGVIIHWLGAQQNESYLLPMNPSVQPGIIDHPALLVGQSWCDPGGALSMAVLSATAAGALVRITKHHC